MSETTKSAPREGSLEAPIRHPLDWRSDSFYDQASLDAELERVFDICHGCRRCVNLCNAFPTLFDLVDESETMEVDGVAKEDYWKVVDQCYLCDLCYMTKCPYVPPHEWNLDFPHLMLRAKAVGYRKGRARMRDKLLSSTDTVGRLVGIPIVVNVANAVNSSGAGRAVLDKTLGVHPDAVLPKYHADTLEKRTRGRSEANVEAQPAGPTRGKVALYTTCYGNYNDPQIGEDLIAVFEHNGIPVRVAGPTQCCGMPKLELGDLEAVDGLRAANIPVLAKLVDEGYDIVAGVPSCVLMYKQELPLMFPDDPDVAKVRDAMFDPFEYLMVRHKHGLLKTDFPNALGKVSYHAACHQRVQNVGAKTREVLSLVPGIELDFIERCSGHDGTYAVKREFHEAAVKICRPIVTRVKKFEPDHLASDCPMAANHIERGVASGRAPQHPISLLRAAYGI